MRTISASTAAELAICKTMNIDPRKLAEHRDKHAQEQATFLGLTPAEFAACRAVGVDAAKFAAQKQKGASSEKPKDDNALDITRDDLGLSKEEIEIAKRMGLDLKAVAEDKRRQEQRRKEGALGEKLGGLPHGNCSTRCERGLTA